MLKKSMHRKPLDRKLSTLRIAKLWSKLEVGKQILSQLLSSKELTYHLLSSSDNSYKTYYIAILSEMFLAYKNGKLKATQPTGIDDSTLNLRYIERDRIFFDMRHCIETESDSIPECLVLESYFLDFYRLEVDRDDFLNWYGVIPSGRALTRWWHESESEKNIAPSQDISLLYILHQGTHQWVYNPNENLTETWAQNWMRSLDLMHAELNQRLGSACLAIDWEHWLTLPSYNWTNEQAALLLCSIDPNEFHQIERYTNFRGLCKPYFVLLQRIEHKTQSIQLWFEWYRVSGLIDLIPEDVLSYYQDNLKTSVAQSTLPKKTKNQQRTEIFHEWFFSEYPGHTLDDMQNALQRFTQKMIKQALIDFSKKNLKQNIWQSGFRDWWKSQGIKLLPGARKTSC